MRGRLILVALVPTGLLALPASPGAARQQADPGVKEDRVEAGLQLTRAAAKEYEFRVGKSDKPLDLHREPILKWSNPEAGNVHGNVFLWTRDGRPFVVGCLYNWFSPRAFTIEHEFHSLAEEPLIAKFHGDAVWNTGAAGVAFADVRGAPMPAANEAQRFLQLKQLAKEFSGTWSVGKNLTDLELRLLPQPIHRYSAPTHGILTGGLFALVRATDPEIFLLIEARGKGAASARWQFAAARMHSLAHLRLRHQNRQVWAAEPLLIKDVFEKHESAYTAFRFKQVPEFLRPENRER